MKKLAILLIFTLLFISNVKKSQAMGLIYTNANYPVTATGVESPERLEDLKKGKSSALNVLGIVEIGDAGVHKAAKEANIKKINFIDINQKSIFLFFSRITTTVYGE